MVDATFSGASYAVATDHHRAHDVDVLAPVRWRAGMRVLDLGCGVGDFTVRVADLVLSGEVFGVDASASQVEHARAAASRPGLRFEVARAQELDLLVPAGWADVVLSVAVLHWLVEGDQPVVWRQVARALAPEGMVRLDMGGAGQIEDTRAELDEVAAAAYGVSGSPWVFPDEASVCGLLVGAGSRPLHVQLLRQRRGMPDEAALEGWLRSHVLALSAVPTRPGTRWCARRSRPRRCAGARRACAARTARSTSTTCAWTPRQLTSERRAGW